MKDLIKKIYAYADKVHGGAVVSEIVEIIEAHVPESPWVEIAPGCRMPEVDKTMFSKEIIFQIENESGQVTNCLGIFRGSSRPYFEDNAGNSYNPQEVLRWMPIMN